MTVSATGYQSETSDIEVLDFEGLTVTISEDSASEAESSVDVTVARSNVDELDNALTVTLTNSDASEASIPTSVEIPVGEARVKAGNSELIAASREQIPVDLPPDWTFEARRIREEAGFRVEARLKGPRELVTKDLVFFCDDYQVNSNLPQHFTSGPKGLEMRFPVSDFAPDNATRFSGVLYHPDGWPGMKTKWLRVSADYR